jgi:hypothetical protein
MRATTTFVEVTDISPARSMRVMNGSDVHESGPRLRRSALAVAQGSREHRGPVSPSRIPPPLGRTYASARTGCRAARTERSRSVGGHCAPVSARFIANPLG